MATTLRTSGITMGDSTLDVSGSAPSFTARAFVNFDGTGVVAIRASGNVSTVADNGTGEYTVNFTTAMPDANYCVTSAFGDPVSSGSTFVGMSASGKTTSAFPVRITSTTAVQDSAVVMLSIFR